MQISSPHFPCIPIILKSEGEGRLFEAGGACWIVWPMGWEFIRGRALIRENTVHVFSRNQTEIVTMKTEKKVYVERVLQDSILF